MIFVIFVSYQFCNVPLNVKEISQKKFECNPKYFFLNTYGIKDSFKLKTTKLASSDEVSRNGGCKVIGWLW